MIFEKALSSSRSEDYTRLSFLTKRSVMSVGFDNLLNAEEFAALPRPLDGSRQELVKGRIVIMPPPSYRHGRIQKNVLVEIDLFLQTHPLGTILGETGVHTEVAPDSIRGPDAAYWSKEKIPLGEDPIGYAYMPADLVVEILSPSNYPAQMQEKIREYFTAGVKIVWIIDPTHRQATIYREPGKGTVLWEEEMLTAEEVLPEFACQVSRLFR